jgi:AhpD family alkylhydroperoxidase
MTSFPIHTVESAPADSKPFLQTIQKRYGFIPNLLAELAESPTVLKAVLALDEAYSASNFTPAEQQAVLLAVSVENGCDFCTSVHSFVARKVARMDPADIEALRAGGTLPTERLNVLAQFTRKLVVKRGWLDDGEVDTFLAQGFTKAQLLEVILGVTYKTLSNYSNHLLHTPINAQFRGEAAARSYATRDSR